MTVDRPGADLFFSDGDELSFPQSEDQAYFQRLADFFIARRGSPLTLSELDWQLARTWLEEGIPAELICRTIDEVFDKREKSGKGKVSSLRYLKPAVARAWKRHQEMNATIEGRVAGEDTEPTLDLSTRLVRLAESLPDDLAGIERWRQEIGSLDGDPEQVEEALADLDSRLLQEAEKGLGPEQQEELDSRLVAALESLKARLPKDELERAGAALREQLLRKQLRLPVLSLFSSPPVSDPTA